MSLLLPKKLYGAILPNELTNEDIKNSKSYKEYYAIASGVVPPKTKASVKKMQVESDTSKTPPNARGKRLKTFAKADKPANKKQPAKTSKAKGLTILSEKSSKEDNEDEVNDDDNNDDDDNDDDVDKDINDDDADNQDDANQDDDDDDEKTYSDNDGDNFVHPKLSTHDDEARKDDEVNEEESNEESDDESNEESDEEVQRANTKDEELDEEVTHEEDKANELYRDVNVNMEGRDTMMTDAPLPNVQATQETEDTHVIITTAINLEGQQQSSSVSSGFISNMLNPRPNIGIDSIITLNTKVTSLVDVPVTTIAEPPLVSATTLPLPPIPLITHMQQTLVLTPKTIPSSSLQDLPNFGSLFGLPQQAKVMTHSSTESKTSLAIAANLSELELKKILIDKMERNKSIHRSDEQKNLYKALVEAYERDKLILDTYAGKEPESTSTPKEKTPKSTGKSTEGSKSLHKSVGKSAHAEEPMYTAKDLEELAHQEFKTGATEDQPVDETPQPFDVQPWLSNLAREEGPRESFDELMYTPLDFSTFMMNRLKVDTLTPELLAGPTFELMKGTCKSLVELEYFFEEVYKATTDQLDWNNPKVQQYPHDLRKPLPLIPKSRGRQVIPFDHFINNDLAYLSGGVSSRTYATFVMKTKAADYSHIKWIEDLGRKRQQFYGFAANRESARDIYYKRRIVAIIKLQIVEWQGYKHLDWITIRRDDDKLYTFKEGDFKRLHLQDIKDMPTLLVQGKLTNLNVKDRLAFGVYLRMFTRSIIIQKRVEDLQLVVESYQKKLKITKPDMYRSDLKRRDAYTAYSNPKGFIYQNKDKKNKLMRIDELHKFSDSTLDDVRTALNDHLKRIRMEYLPQTI
ncbi:hypothetical protein Tco_1532897 [Tanacetum coccineum]